ncbi:hypothetical protein [Massilia scottii]|uniref:hypothetical protein n=1 Tax=Massilia scottii TaxID=3057166 RepID=UPI0027967874|nr:hypothetical protein [Massilia sp. CCM 9029]MDQ1835187.1 hypothetical protein [Massilia sp. CCM 9029]
MKAFVSIFPSGRAVATLATGQLVTANDDDEMVILLHQAGVKGFATATEYVWDRRMFPMHAFLSTFPSGRVVISMPNGSIFVSTDMDDLLFSIAQAGATKIGAEHSWNSDIFETCKQDAGT